MITRSIYSIFTAFKYRHQLFNVAFYVSDTRIVSVEKLININNKIKVVVLDFDGVLSPHGHTMPADKIKPWLDCLIKCKRLKKVYIFSNKPTELRLKYFSLHYPEIKFISNIRKKPYPDGLKIIAEHEDVSLINILMIDDRLLTGILAAYIAGTSCVYITNPLIDFTSNRKAELFYYMLRLMEKMYIFLLRWV